MKANLDDGHINYIDTHICHCGIALFCEMNETERVFQLPEAIAPLKIYRFSRLSNDVYNKCDQ